MGEVFLESDATGGYSSRTRNRELTLMKATMSFVGYFMGLGDDQTTAESKVSDVSTEVAQFLYVYTLGNTQPLIDAINNIDEVAFPYMDAAAKAKITGDLTV
jgi:hypothetical protein